MKVLFESTHERDGRVVIRQLLDDDRVRERYEDEDGWVYQSCEESERRAKTDHLGDDSPPTPPAREALPALIQIAKRRGARDALRQLLRYRDGGEWNE